MEQRARDWPWEDAIEPRAVAVCMNALSTCLGVNVWQPEAKLPHEVVATGLRACDGDDSQARHIHVLRGRGGAQRDGDAA